MAIETYEGETYDDEIVRQASVRGVFTDTPSRQVSGWVSSGRRIVGGEVSDAVWQDETMVVTGSLDNPKPRDLRAWISLAEYIGGRVVAVHKRLYKGSEEIPSDIAGIEEYFDVARRQQIPRAETHRSWLGAKAFNAVARQKYVAQGRTETWRTGDTLYLTPILSYFRKIEAGTEKIPQRGHYGLDMFNWNVFAALINERFVEEGELVLPWQEDLHPQFKRASEHDRQRAAAELALLYARSS